MANKLWTKNFTIITLGTVVSLFGSAMTGFSISLLVLDYSQSVFLYALFMVAYLLPQLCVPIVAGSFLDRFSRRKTIYTLDFISSAVYFSVFGYLCFFPFSYPLLLAVTLLIGSIDSFYRIAYESLYPNLITEGHYAKAYAVSSMIESLAMAMVPVAVWVYSHAGIRPILLCNGVSFLVAAVMETQITLKETYAESRTSSRGFGAFKTMLREGVAYIGREPGLMAVCAYFFVDFFVYGACDTVTLPYFRTAAGLGVTVYIYVKGALIAGRLIGGALNYRFKIPRKRRFTAALFVYFALAAIGAIYLYTPVAVMTLLSFATGMFGATSYNIRISATQNYIPDNVRARFNGVFAFITTGGLIFGQFLGGALAQAVALRTIVLVFSVFKFAGVFATVCAKRRQVAAVYGKEI